MGVSSLTISLRLSQQELLDMNRLWVGSMCSWEMRSQRMSGSEHVEQADIRRAGLELSRARHGELGSSASQLGLHPSLVLDSFRQAHAVLGELSLVVWSLLIAWSPTVSDKLTLPRFASDLACAIPRALTSAHKRPPT